PTVLSGRTLRDLRLTAGLSQVEVARRVGIVPTVLSAYERGRRQPSAAVAGRIIDAMGYDITFVRRLDPEVQARRLVDVLTLAEALPYRPRPLATARV
ncbi:MAG: helix-turn-helix domain-containing protein, partial [Actinomycetota bacterium]